MRILTILTLCTAPATLAAQTACPTAEAFEAGGIVFTVDDQQEVYTEVHTRAKNGVITITSEEDANGVAVRSIVAHGVHVLQLSDVIDGAVDRDSIWRFAFPIPVVDLPKPVPNQTWETSSKSIVDGVSSVEQITHSWGEEGIYTIGDCSYAAIPVRAVYESEDYDHAEDMVYFPALGTAILLRYEDSESSSTYTYTAIRAQ